MEAINLLPWRQRRRQRRLRCGLTGVAGAIALALLGIGLAGVKAEQAQDLAQARQAALEQQLQQMLDSGGGRRYGALLAQDQVIGRWQARREALPLLLRQWAGTVPDGVALTSVELRGNGVLLQGRAVSQGPIERYLRTLREASWLQAPEMAALRAGSRADGEGGGLSAAFTVKATLRAPWLSPADGAPR